MNSSFIKRVISKVGSKQIGKKKKLQISEGTKISYNNWEKAKSPPLSPTASETNEDMIKKKLQFKKPFANNKLQLKLKPTMSSSSSFKIFSSKSATEFRERRLKDEEKILKYEMPLNKMQKNKLKAKLNGAKTKRKVQERKNRKGKITDTVIVIPDQVSGENNTDPHLKPEVKFTLKEENEMELPEGEAVQDIETEPEEAVLEQLENENKNCVKYSDTVGGKTVVIPSGKAIHFQGVLELKALKGKVEVLGYEIGSNSGTFRLYSPRGTSFLYMKNISNAGTDATVVCSKVEDTNIRFIEKHVSQQILPEKRDQFQLKFEPQGNLIRISPDWDKLISMITNNTQLLVIGGKRVGKSTFIRYAVNKLLMTHKCVRIIDLDPGQSEFTIPGCVSIVTVKEPLLGPNYTHLKKTDSAILSNINPDYDQKKYVESVKCLFKTLDSSKIPTLINYMGYTSDMGINIASSVISIVMPTDIVEIYSKNTKKNFTNSFEDTSSVFQNATLLENNVAQLTYSYHRIQSMCDRNDAWSAEPRVLREMCILSYFGQMLSSKSILSTKLPLYEINLSEITPVDAAGQSLPLEVLNSSLIALCSAVQDNIFKCHGWGIVRGVDRDLNIAVILTPENPQVLDDVTHLVHDELALPPSIYMTPDGNIGQVSYVISGELQDFGKITKRSYKPV